MEVPFRWARRCRGDARGWGRHRRAVRGCVGRLSPRAALCVPQGEVLGWHSASFLKLLWRVPFCSPPPLFTALCCGTCVCILIHSFLLRACVYVCVRLSAFPLVLPSAVCLGHILMHNIPSIKLWLNAECVRTWQPGSAGAGSRSARTRDAGEPCSAWL